MNAKTLLGLGAIGGAVYLATSKKAQAKVKQTTGLSDKIEKGQNIYVFKDHNGYNVLYFNKSQGVYGRDFYDTKAEIDKLKKYWKTSGAKLHKSLPKNIKNRPTGLSDDREVADIILRQLGGNKFKAMTGAKNFTAGKNSLNFKLPANSTKKRINYVTIKLNGSDTYDMYFKKIPSMKAFSDGAEIKTIIEYKDVYFDQLQKLFTEATGLLTRL